MEPPFRSHLQGRFKPIEMAPIFASPIQHNEIKYHNHHIASSDAGEISEGEQEEERYANIEYQDVEKLLFQNQRYK